MNFKKFLNIDRWFQGPKFLWKPQSSWETSSVPVSLQPEDPKLKKQVKTNKIVVEDDPLGKIEEKHSCWLKMKRIIALMLKWKISIEQKKRMMPSQSEKVLDFSINNLNLLDVELLQDAEKCIVKMVELKHFNTLEKPDINNDCKHPVLMPKSCHISKLIILRLNNWLIVL